MGESRKNNQGRGLEKLHRPQQVLSRRIFAVGVVGGGRFVGVWNLMVRQGLSRPLPRRRHEPSAVRQPDARPRLLVRAADLGGDGARQQVGDADACLPRPREEKRLVRQRRRRLCS